MSYRSKPVFSSAARLAALARFVSNNTSSEPLTPIPSAISNDRLPERNYNLESATSVIPGQGYGQSYQTVEPKYETNKRNTNMTSSHSIEDLLPTNQNYVETNGSIMSVTSAGFKFGNFSEFKFGQKVFVPKQQSRRGLSLLCLTPDHTAFHAWNFDFYPNITRNATNRNFINILLALPGNIYFSLAVKDDAHRNLFEPTKNFLSRVVGLKTIYRLEYRDSWCAIIYKKSPQTFEVLEESHNSNGVAHVQVNIPEKGPPSMLRDPIQPAIISAKNQQHNYDSVPSPASQASDISRGSWDTSHITSDIPHLDPDIEISEPNTPRQDGVNDLSSKYFPPINSSIHRNLQHMGKSRSNTAQLPIHRPYVSEKLNSHSQAVQSSAQIIVERDVQEEVPRKEPMAITPIADTLRKSDHDMSVVIKNIENVSVLVKEQQSALKDIRKEIERMKVHIKEQLEIVRKILTTVSK